MAKSRPHPLEGGKAVDELRDLSPTGSLVGGTPGIHPGEPRGHVLLVRVPTWAQVGGLPGGPIAIPAVP